MVNPFDYASYAVKGQANSLFKAYVTASPRSRFVKVPGLYPPRFNYRKSELLVAKAKRSIKAMYYIFIFI